MTAWIGRVLQAIGRWVGLDLRRFPDDFSAYVPVSVMSATREELTQAVALATANAELADTRAAASETARLAEQADAAARIAVIEAECGQWQMRYDRLAARHLEWPEALTPNIVDAARRESHQQDTEHPDHGQGEVKRHRVYARLMKEYPDTDKRTLAFAIELAQQERVL